MGTPQLQSNESVEPVTKQRLGAWRTEGTFQFALWSDRAERASVVLFAADGALLWEEPMSRAGGDPHVFQAAVDCDRGESLYKFKLDGVLVGDPYARSLPFGPKGPAEVPTKLRERAHPRRSIDLAQGEVIYELHVGTFTLEGTFVAASERLPHLRDLGVTVIELMPLATFPGARGWGYDGVGLFAPFHGYGTPAELSAFVDAAHAQGMAVLLDAVFNHLGPDGNHLPAYSERYFHPTRTNAWGAAPALEETPFRNLVVDCARHWLEEYGFDGLRLDATHELEPGGAPHIVREIAAIAAALSPPALIVAEDNRNDPNALFAMGVDAVWGDDFHHSLHVLLTGERDGYYARYQGTLSELAQIIEHGELDPHRQPSPRRQSSSELRVDVARQRRIYALQNHDQIGNRALGERLDQLVDPRQARAAALLLLFLPCTPLLFMGQEWATKTPFLYFTDHVEPLGSEVTKGRRAEFAHFAAFGGDSTIAIPDPQAEQTFERSKLDWSELKLPDHALAHELYRTALKLRREDSWWAADAFELGVEGDVLWILRRNASGDRRLLLFNPGPSVELERAAGLEAAVCRLLLASDHAKPHAERFSLPAHSTTIFAVGSLPQ